MSFITELNHLKAGDTFAIKVEVGFVVFSVTSFIRTFYVPGTVARTTKTLIVDTEGRRWQKRDGKPKDFIRMVGRRDMVAAQCQSGDMTFSNEATIRAYEAKLDLISRHNRFFGNRLSLGGVVDFETAYALALEAQALTERCAELFEQYRNTDLKWHERETADALTDVTVCVENTIKIT